MNFAISIRGTMVHPVNPNTKKYILINLMLLQLI